MLMSIGTLTATVYQNVQIDGIYYYLDDNANYSGEYIQYAEVRSNPNKYAGKITIPDSVEYEGVKFAVKAIGNEAFRDCSNLTAVTISEGVERINNNYAFYNCSSLTTITIPSTMNYFGYYTFSGCNSLQEVKISDLSAWCYIDFQYAENNPLYYAHHLFLNNTEVTNLVIPEGITELKRHAFRDCKGLKSITFPAGFTRIGHWALAGTELTSIDIPEGITNIGESAFGWCQSLTSITFPESVTLIESGAFQNCSMLQSVVLPSSIISISASLFYNCTGLKSVTIPNTVEGIGSGAFQNCTSLSSIDLPESVTSIGSQAFRYSGLNSIELPNSIENIANEVFRECHQLTSVTIGTNVANIHSSAFNYCDKLNTIIWNATDFADFGSASLSPFYNYRNNITSFTFGENIIHIPAYMCYEMNNLSRIDIPASVTGVGEGAFAYCGRLTEINAAAGSPLYSSEDGVLFNKTKTSLIIYPAGRSAANYTVPSTVQTIEENAFYGCENLSAITIPASVTSIGAGNATIPMWSFEGTVPPNITNDAFPSDVYIIVDDADTYKAAWPEYASRIFPRQYAEQTLSLTAQADKSSLHVAIGEDNLANVIKLTISGSINSYDLMIMRNKMINLRELDLTEASIEANAYAYYTGLCSHTDTLLAHSFRGLRSIKLPRTLKYAEQAMIDCPDIKYIEFYNGVVGTQIAPYQGNGDLQVVLNEGVTEIKPYAFAVTNAFHTYYNNNATEVNTKLRSITLPNSLGIVSAKRFWYCRNLIEVNLGNAISKIDDYAFCECAALTSIVLPEALDTIGNFAFQGANIAEITIPSEVKFIGNGAFLSKLEENSWGNWNPFYRLVNGIVLYSSRNDVYYYDNATLVGRSLFCSDGDSYYHRFFNSSSLKSITFAPDSQLKEIGAAAFAFSQMESLAIPDSVAVIGDYAFAGNKQLKSLVFGENSEIRSIKRGVFQNTTALEHLVLPGKLTTIEELAFSSHDETDALAEITFPTVVKDIKRAAFYGRKGLHRISFPTSLQTIGAYAFNGCTNLDEIRVPSSLLSVGDHAFDDCSNVTKVYTYTVEPVSIDQNTFSCWQNADLYVPSTSYYNYYYNTQWSQFLSLQQFDEEYTYFYINNDYELGGNTGIIDGKPDADLNEESGLIITGETEQQVGTITVAGDENGAASIIACEDNLTADSLIIRLITKKGTWSYFCFPFDVLLEQLYYPFAYVIREYDGATRAQYGAGGWRNMVGDLLQKGLGYIFQGARTDTIQITIPNPRIGCEDYEQVIQAYNAENDIHANWNFIGNPYPSWYDLDVLFTGGFSSPVYIWDASIHDYRVYRPGDDEYHFHPYEGFFTQNPNEQAVTVTWSSDGRETKTQVDNKRNNGNGHHARKYAREQRQQEQQRLLINLELATDDYTARTRVVFNEQARTAYELGKDAAMMDGGEAPLHIWSNQDNNRMAINERPYTDGRVALGFDAREAGFVSLSAARMDKDVILYDNELRQEVDLSQGAYTFYTEAGTNNTRFAIIRIKEKEGNEAALSEVENADEIVSVYNLLGQKLIDRVRRSDIRLQTGVYVIENSNGARTEMTIEH